MKNIKCGAKLCETNILKYTVFLHCLAPRNTAILVTWKLIQCHSALRMALWTGSYVQKKKTVKLQSTSKGQCCLFFK